MYIYTLLTAVFRDLAKEAAKEMVVEKNRTESTYEAMKEM